MTTTKASAVRSHLAPTTLCAAQQTPFHQITATLSAAAAIEPPRDDPSSSSSPGSSLASLKEATFSLPETFWNDLERASAWQPKASDWNLELCRQVTRQHDGALERLYQQEQETGSAPENNTDVDRLLSPETAVLALKVLLKCHFEQVQDLSNIVRKWESQWGGLGRTEMTDHLSLRLVTANGKAGNVGRCLALLDFRRRQEYRPRHREFTAAVTAIRIAGKTASLSWNPTRWLDAVLMNMKQRYVKLTTSLANQMLNCFAVGSLDNRAVHHFYRVVRQKPDPSKDTNSLPVAFYFDKDLNYQTYQPVQVRLKYSRHAPPFYKIPSVAASAADKATKLRLERENDPDFSPPLHAAFSFADSLSAGGACGHDPVQLNTASYNALIKACVERGALWRAMYVLDVNMTAEDAAPNHKSYNLILAGLARVGDVVTAEKTIQKMINAGLSPDAFTVRAIVDGLLNAGDAPAAVTVAQDFFNQHSVLPPYTTHCKILEFCLAQGLVHEAKRYIYFLQQLWHWEPNEYHSEDFVQLMRATQGNTQLQKPALQKLFAYFGESLEDSDFL
jgi:pentatricopeptide repeat protein